MVDNQVNGSRGNQTFCPSKRICIESDANEDSVSIQKQAVPLLSASVRCIPSSIVMTPEKCVRCLEEDISSATPAFSMMYRMLLHCASCEEGCTVSLLLCLECSWSSTACGSTFSSSTFPLVSSPIVRLSSFLLLTRSLPDVVSSAFSFPTFATARTRIVPHASMRSTHTPFPPLLHTHIQTQSSQPPSLCLLSPLSSLPSFDYSSFSTLIQHSLAPWWKPGSLKAEFLRILAVLQAAEFRFIVPFTVVAPNSSSTRWIPQQRVASTITV